MKLQYVPDGSGFCPLIRMYQFESAEIERLLTELTALASGQHRVVPIHDLPATESIADCKFFLHLGSRDRGTRVLPEPASFECVLTPDGWEQVASLVEPFLQSGKHGYQWLDAYCGISNGDFRWLLSRDGDW